MSNKISFEILNYIVAQGPLFTQVEEFLDTVGENELSQTLAKLEQDAGLQVFNDIGVPDSEERPAEEDLHAARYFIGETDMASLLLSSALINNRDFMTYNRLAVLNDVAKALDQHGAPFASTYTDMMKSFSAMLPTEAKEAIAPTLVRWDLI